MKIILDTYLEVITTWKNSLFKLKFKFLYSNFSFM